jgi:two-component system, NtrC family, C4-dicarboxylate transport sensor histidine kinase DctB
MNSLAKHKVWSVLLTLGLVLVAFTVLFMSYHIALMHNLTKLQVETRTTAQLRTLVLQSELDKQRAIPLILADDSDIKSAVSQPNISELQHISRKLEKLKNGTHSAVIYILNNHGVALASSNWALSTSFVGNDYSFREYFQQAMANGYAEQFALGTVSRKPGLYLAQRILVNEKAIGIVVVKVEFDDMETAWAKAQDQTFVIDAQDHILLSFNPDWRFQEARVADNNSLSMYLAAPVQGWRLQVITGLAPAQKAAQAALIMALMAEVLIAMVLIFWRRRNRQLQEKAHTAQRYREQLELDVAARTHELSQTNLRLSQEITEHQQAQRKLNQLQADLVQANKLAALGQITAGVAHELNQPLSAIRLYAENTLRLLKKTASAPDLVTENLNNIVRMSDRIGHITGDLRAFSRKATHETEALSLKETVNSSVILNKSRLKEDKVNLFIDPIDAELQVVAGRIRLEQVIVNLLQNAFEAVEKIENPSVRMTLTDQGDTVTLSIRDNGPGLAPEIYDKLFIPFVTTKLTGLGLGLVIAHDIIHDFGGKLSADTSTDGATFHVTLRKVHHD